MTTKKLGCDCGDPTGQHRGLGCGVPLSCAAQTRLTAPVDDPVSDRDALVSVLHEIRNEASGFSQRQSERHGFTDACLRMTRIEAMAHRVLKSVGR